MREEAKIRLAGRIAAHRGDMMGEERILTTEQKRVFFSVVVSLFFHPAPVVNGDSAGLLTDLCFFGMCGHSDLPSGHFYLKSGL